MDLRYKPGSQQGLKHTMNISDLDYKRSWPTLLEKEKGNKISSQYLSNSYKTNNMIYLSDCYFKPGDSAWQHSYSSQLATPWLVTHTGQDWPEASWGSNPPLFPSHCSGWLWTVDPPLPTYKP